ncbi:hypothetical protein Rmet_6532 [Cupriavidus metallidurans CH34]|uniref:Uncharacterized protein n=1 Tax=Cupriavidus metallidurans (strain ATCC 43123 / DSM 2839 / NBRC 102507 / CH34) TaxID=266264 RepID=D3DXW9_CUPMC|nr:hypothetical protein Rmet_6532 [Cupriavidus metallidurans CH34]
MPQLFMFGSFRMLAQTINVPRLSGHDWKADK